ncbi:MAG: hypothetical protein ABEJ25_05100, partial [Candidatus Bipolaricaulia bacterium]
LYYAKVKNTKIVKRKDIPIPSSVGGSDEEPYVKFELGPKIHELDKPILNLDGDLVTFRFGTLYTLRRAEYLVELYLTDPTLQKEWRDIQQRGENLRPYVSGWKKDDFGNYEAEIEFEEQN